MTSKFTQLPPSRALTRSAQLLFWAGLTALLTLGFRTYPNGGTWPIDNSSSTASKLFVDYTLGASVIKNDLPAGDPLYGVAGTTVDQLMTSIFSDFNNVAASYVTLVNTSDGDYNATNGLHRTITIRFTGADGASAGEAKLVTKSGKVVGCDIVAEPALLDSAKDFVRTLTHELGHCMGLDHAQETVNAIMSYFHDRDGTARLMIDDKMGLTFLYPTDKTAAKETPTLGLSCARKD